MAGGRVAGGDTGHAPRPKSANAPSLPLALTQLNTTSAGHYCLYLNKGEFGLGAAAIAALDAVSYNAGLGCVNALPRPPVGALGRGGCRSMRTPGRSIVLLVCRERIDQ